MTRKKSPPDALGAALRLLGFRQRSVKELERRLEDKGYGTEEIAKTLDYLVGSGYLDDAKYARDLVLSRARVRNWGPLKIASELKAKGFSEETIKGAKALLDIDTETQAARAALGKWAKSNSVKAPLSREDLARAYRFLLGRGFSAGAIKQAAGSIEGQDEL